MIKIDVHNLTLLEAKKVIIDAINTAYKYNESSVYVVHGFNNGTVIKNFLASYHNAKVLHIHHDLSNPGATIINIKLKIF